MKRSCKDNDSDSDRGEKNNREIEVIFCLHKLKLLVVARRYDGGTVRGSMTVVSAGRRRPVLGPNLNFTY